MTKPPAALAFAVALLTAAPANATWLSDKDAARLAELAFIAGSDRQHGEITADQAIHLRDTPRYLRFQTQFALSDMTDGWAFFVVDRLTGATWMVDVHHCIPVDSSALQDFRAALHLEPHPAAPLPPDKLCRLD